MCLSWNYTYQGANKVTLGIKNGGRKTCRYVYMVVHINRFLYVFLHCLYIFTISIHRILHVRNIKQGNYSLVWIKTKQNEWRKTTLLSRNGSKFQVNVSIKAMVYQAELSRTWASTGCRAEMYNPLGKSSQDILALFPPLLQVPQPEMYSQW